MMTREEVREIRKQFKKIGHLVWSQGLWDTAVALDTLSAALEVVEAAKDRDNWIHSEGGCHPEDPCPLCESLKPFLGEEKRG